MQGGTPFAFVHLHNGADASPVIQHECQTTRAGEQAFSTLPWNEHEALAVL